MSIRPPPPILGPVADVGGILEIVGEERLDGAQCADWPVATLLRLTPLRMVRYMNASITFRGGWALAGVGERALRGGQGDWFLAEHVFAGLQRLDGPRDVRWLGSGL